MTRRVALKSSMAAAAPEPTEMVFDDEPAGSAPSSYGSRDASEIDGIIAGVISLSPRKLNESLERSERVGSRDLSIIYKSLDEENSHVRESAQLVLIAIRAYGRLKVDEAVMKARLKAEAQEKAPRGTNKDGSPKALTVDAAQDYYRSHPNLIAIRYKLADYEGYVEHCKLIAKRRTWNAKSLEELLSAARATGTGKTSGYGEDDKDRS